MNCGELRDLHALYVDGELAAPVEVIVEAHLHRCAGCRELVDRARTMKSALRKAHRYAAPPFLAARLWREIRPSPAGRLRPLRHLGMGWKPMVMAASLLLVVAVSMGITRAYVAPNQEEQVVAQVVASHIRSLMAEHLTDVALSQKSGMFSPFAAEIEVAPPIPDMASAGYTLVGGRLDYVADHRCAALVYRRDKNVINLEVWNRNSADDAVTEIYRRGGYSLVHMTDNNLDYWAVSDLGRTELLDFMREYALAADRQKL